MTKILYSLPLAVLLLSQCTNHDKRLMNNPNDYRSDQKEEQKEEQKVTDETSKNYDELWAFTNSVIEKLEEPEALHILENEEIILFYGTTGIGKSTIINYMLGNQLEKKDIEEKNDGESFGGTKSKNSVGKPYRVKLKKNLDKAPKIGPSDAKSETSYPYPYFIDYKESKLVDNEDSKRVGIKDLKLGYCDTPGFSDNRGKKNIIGSFIGNNLIIKKCKKIKGICFVTSLASLSNNRGQSFLDNVAYTISNFMIKTNDFDPLNSVFILFNNKNNHLNSNRTLLKKSFMQLKDFRNNYQEQLKKNDVNSNIIEVYINILDKIIKENKRILVIDPLDQGKSRKSFLKRISKSKVIPKDNIRRLSSKDEEKVVKDLLKCIMKEATIIFDNIDKSKLKIEEYTKEEKELVVTKNNLEKSNENIINKIKESKNKIKETSNQISKLETDIKLIYESRSKLSKKSKNLSQELKKKTDHYDYLIKKFRSQKTK